jgi:toxin CcdB
MARFDVYPMPNNRRGYVVDVQANLLNHLVTRVVVPLLPLDAFQSPIRDLNPIFEIDGVPHVFAPQSIATVPLRSLGAVKTSLDREYDSLTRALDILLTGI